jgi:hypothetical protein
MAKVQVIPIHQRYWNKSEKVFEEMKKTGPFREISDGPASLDPVYNYLKNQYTKLVELAKEYDPSWQSKNLKK